MTSETHGRFKRWFWRPPRPHGEIIADRQVSVLELFYDLVYVAVLGQADTFRHADTMMRQLTEDEFLRGKERLRRAVRHAEDTANPEPRSNWLDLLVLR